MNEFPTISGLLKFLGEYCSHAYFKHKSEDVPNSEVLFLLPIMGIQFYQDNAILIAHQK